MSLIIIRVIIINYNNVLIYTGKIIFDCYAAFEALQFWIDFVVIRQ